MQKSKAIEEKEKLVISLTRIQDKITSFGPELSTNLAEVETELKKALKIIVVDDELSPTEEYRTYPLQSTDTNFASDINLDSVKIPTRHEALNAINQTRLTKKNRQEKEPEILAEITRLEAEKSRINTLQEISTKHLRQSCAKIKVNFKTLEIETPAIERPKERESS